MGYCFRIRATADQSLWPSSFKVAALVEASWYLSFFFSILCASLTSASAYSYAANASVESSLGRQATAVAFQQWWVTQWA